MVISIEFNAGIVSAVREVMVNIPKFIMQAILTGRKVGMQGARPIYEITFNGTTHRVAVTVGTMDLLLVQIWFLNK